MITEHQCRPGFRSKSRYRYRPLMALYSLSLCQQGRSVAAQAQSRQMSPSLLQQTRAIHRGVLRSNKWFPSFPSDRAVVSFVCGTFRGTLHFLSIFYISAAPKWNWTVSGQRGEEASLSDERLQAVFEETGGICRWCSFSSAQVLCDLTTSRTCRRKFDPIGTAVTLHVGDGVLLRSNRLALPKAMRRNTLNGLRAAHGGA